MRQSGNKRTGPKYLNGKASWWVSLKTEGPHEPEFEDKPLICQKIPKPPKVLLPMGRGNALTDNNEDYTFPTDKLKSGEGVGNCKNSKWVVLVACGSFNPPTNFHLRMFEVAKQALAEEGYNVLGGYLSPVNDEYKKPQLLAATHRLAMCRLACEGSDLVMVDDWEARQPKYQRSKEVLAHFTEELGRQPLCAVDASGQPVPVQVMLLCGTDLLESFVRPGVWRPGDVEHILVTHGVACVLRRGCDLGTLLVEEGAPLRRFHDRVILVKEPFDNSVSSSTVRQELRRGHSVKYIVSDAVIEYIKAKGLYAEDELET